MDKRIEKIYGYIKRNYQEKLLLDDLARKVKLSPFYFQRLFKHEMGETPSECINRIRLERSAHLMKAGNHSGIAQIASDCGFSSASTFTRAFKQLFHLSPMAFVKSNDNPIKIFLKKEAIESFAAEIVYLPEMHVYYHHTSVVNKNLFREMQAAKIFCETNHIVTTGKMMGMITHHTFHYPDQQLNYYAGITVQVSEISKLAENVFRIPEGKYACFITRESCMNLREVLMLFKVSWLDKSCYKWGDLIAYEEFLPDNKTADYPYFKRKVYVPIIKK